MRTRLLTPHATGIPVLDAQSDFRRARRAYAAARARRWVTGPRSPNRPAALLKAAPVLGGRSQLKVVPLSQIVGTVDRTSHFDACFRPASELIRQRWERVALAQRRGIPLPPIELVRGPDGGYYVIDGRHRVSVARARRLTDTDAWVHAPVHCSADQPRVSSTPHLGHATLTEPDQGASLRPSARQKHTHCARLTWRHPGHANSLHRGTALPRKASLKSPPAP
jgi:hypothetical protein